MNTPAKPAAPVATTSRSDLTARHHALERSLAGMKLADAVNGTSQALRYFEDHTRTEREQLLKAGLIKAREDVAFSTWTSERYDHLLRLARDTVMRAFAETGADRKHRTSICALAILLSGHSIKWRKVAGTRPDATTREWLHQIFRTAVSFGDESTVLSVRIEERPVDATVEALYVRALLLDRFTGGNLPPNRLEILDNWLVVWMDALWLTREAPAGEPTLGINTAAAQRGLTPYLRGDGAHLFLSLRPLQRQLDRAIRTFHRGEIFPGWGIGATAAMEEHVAVIDFLENEFTLIETARVQRGKRLASAGNAVVGVFFGFKEICAMAFSSARASSLAGGGGELGIRNAIHLVDISEGGLGLDMIDEDARKVRVGDLVAVRLEKGRPCVLGTVVRKSNLQRPTATLIGVKVLAKSPMHLPMERVDAATNTWQPCEGVLIAGALANGFADSIVVSEDTYVANSLIAVTVANRNFELHLGRIRQQGPGWRMAAIDADDAQ